jgi:hypothetical protein
MHDISESRTHFEITQELFHSIEPAPLARRHSQSTTNCAKFSTRCRLFYMYECRGIVAHAADRSCSGVNWRRLSPLTSTKVLLAAIAAAANTGDSSTSKKG